MNIFLKKNSEEVVLVDISNTIKWLLCILLFILLLCFIVFFKDIKLISDGERYEYKVYKSPQGKNSLTLLLHTDGAGFNYQSFIYILPGEYKQKKKPANERYIKFPDGTGVAIDWKSEKLVWILCDSEPTANSLETKGFVVKIKIDRSYFDSLVEKGYTDKFTRYTIEAE